MEVPSCLGHPGIGTEVGSWLFHPSNCPLLIHVYPIWPTFILISFVLLHAVFHRIFIQLSSSFPPLSILVNPMIIHFFPFKRAAPDWDDQRVDGSRHSFAIRESSWPHEISWNMEQKLGNSQLLFASMPHKGVHFFRTILITCSDLTAFINDGTYHTLYILETMSLVATTSGFWDWFFLFPRCGTLNDPLQKIWHECTWFPYWTNGIPSRSSYIRGSPLLQHFSWLLAHLCWFFPTWLLVWIPFSLFEDVNINFLVDQCFMFAISNDFSCLNYVRIFFFGWFNP